MKKFLLLTTLLCGWMGSAMAADENTITVMEATEEAGVVTVQLEMVNPTLKAVAFQCDVKAPEGVSFDEKLLSLTLSDRKDDHVIRFNILSDGSLRMVAYSMQNLPFSGTSGAIVSFDVDLEETTIFTVDNVVIADASSASAKPNSNSGEITIDDTTGDVVGNVNGDPDGIVDIDDLNALVNILLGKEVPDTYNGNVNGDPDGVVDVDDLNALINILLGK